MIMTVDPINLVCNAQKRQCEPDPNYLRSIISDSKMSIAEAARRVGVSIRTMHDYLDPMHPSNAPFSVVFCLEYINSIENSNL